MYLLRQEEAHQLRLRTGHHKSAPASRYVRADELVADFAGEEDV